MDSMVDVLVDKYAGKLGLTKDDPQCLAMVFNYLCRSMEKIFALEEEKKGLLKEQCRLIDKLAEKEAVHDAVAELLQDPRLTTDSFKNKLRLGLKDFDIKTNKSGKITLKPKKSDV